MPGIFAAIAVAAYMAVSGSHAVDRRWNAPVPDQCRTFEHRFAPDNKARCDAWFEEHRH